MMALTSVSMSVGGLNSKDCGWTSVGVGLCRSAWRDHWWWLEVLPDSATRDVLKMGDAGWGVNTVCLAVLQWTGDEVWLFNDNLATVSRLCDAEAFEAGSTTVLLCNHTAVIKLSALHSQHVKNNNTAIARSYKWWLLTVFLSKTTGYLNYDYISKFTLLIIAKSKSCKIKIFQTSAGTGMLSTSQRCEVSRHCLKTS